MDLLKICALIALVIIEIIMVFVCVFAGLDITIWIIIMALITIPIFVFWIYAEISFLIKLKTDKKTAAEETQTNENFADEDNNDSLIIQPYDGDSDDPKLYDKQYNPYITDDSENEDLEYDDFDKDDDENDPYDDEDSVENFEMMDDITDFFK